MTLEAKVYFVFFAKYTFFVKTTDLALTYILINELSYLTQHKQIQFNTLKMNRIFMIRFLH